MNYKEIQVPSETIKVIFQEILDAIRPYEDQCKAKFQKDMSDYIENAKLEDDAREYVRKHDRRIWLWSMPNMNPTPTNLYKEIEYECNKFIKAAELAPSLTMTESQVQQLNAKSFVKEVALIEGWLEQKPYLDDYWQNKMKDIKDEQEQKKEPVVEPETPKAEPPQTPEYKETPMELPSVKDFVTFLIFLCVIGMIFAVCI